MASKARTYIAVIGDMVHSRELSAPARAAAQRAFMKLIALLNKRFSHSIAAQFVITLGDEFQGLLSNADVIPELVWQIETSYSQRDVRLGIGYGALHTPLRKVALNIDGPALHNARTAITEAASGKLLGGVFHGFGPHDDILTGFAQILRQARRGMTARQRQVVGLLRTGQTQQKTSIALRISKQAVSDHAIAAGWEAYKLAEQGWTKALELATQRGSGDPR